MNALSIGDLESLIGVRPDDRHPLEIMGYDYTDEGVRAFRRDRPDFLPQIREHIQAILRADSIFPSDTNRDAPGWQSFIESAGRRFALSTVEEVGVGRYDRFRTEFNTEEEAIEAFLNRVCNPDYLPIQTKQNC
jgi:hypothetical protein